MEKTFLEKQIEKRAYQKLDEEYSVMIDTVMQNAILRDVVVDGKRLFVFPDSMENVNLKPEYREALDKRFKVLIEQETKEVLKKLDGINYLFNES